MTQITIPLKQFEACLYRNIKSTSGISKLQAIIGFDKKHKILNKTYSHNGVTMVKLTFETEEAATWFALNL